MKVCCCCCCCCYQSDRDGCEKLSRHIFFKLLPRARKRTSQKSRNIKRENLFLFSCWERCERCRCNRQNPSEEKALKVGVFWKKQKKKHSLLLRVKCIKFSRKKFGEKEKIAVRKNREIEGQISMITYEFNRLHNWLDWLATVETTSFTYRSRWSTEINARAQNLFFLKKKKENIFLDGNFFFFFLLSYI